MASSKLAGLARQEEEKRELLAWSGRPSKRSISCAHRLIERWAKDTPDAIALIDGPRELTYAELDARANALARRLRAVGVRSSDHVAIDGRRSAETLVGIAAILKAGAAYVPIDPELPRERRARMVARSGVKVGVGDFSALLPTSVPLDVFDADVVESSNLELAHDPAQTMVVLHTSGTTGEPKGVLLTHRGMVNYALAMADAWKVSRADTILQFASLAFDASLEEILLAWTSGAKLVLRSEAMLAPATLLRACRDRAVTLLDLPTAYLPMLLDEVEQSGWLNELRRVVIGGDRALPSVIERFHATIDAPHLSNTYGPTEGSISVTYCETEAWLDDEKKLRSESPLGRVVDGCRVYVLDSAAALAPIDVAGEIHVGGDAVAQGYVSDAAQTAEKFLP
ncbi:MAG: AMP-binding protein, partial [Polyangiaceae bacterium]